MTVQSAAPTFSAPLTTAQSPASNLETSPPLEVPRHLAVIMDGNGRWARSRGLPRVEGHQAGVRAVRSLTQACCELGIKFLTVYAFSTENWKRPKEEVAALFSLLEHFLPEELPSLQANNVRLQAIGRLHQLPEGAQHVLNECIAKTAQNTGLTLVLALNYSGRTELEDAIREICREVREGRLQPEDFSQAHLSARLYTGHWPDPDLLIRTSGEMRLSNFLLWQLSYTELYVTPKLWPDFGKDDLRAAVQEFQRRQRRYGGI